MYEYLYKYIIEPIPKSPADIVHLVPNKHSFPHVYLILYVWVELIACSVSV